MDPRETLRGIVGDISRSILWEEPKSVGTAQVNHVTHPRRDMVYLKLGPEEEFTAKTAVFTPPGFFKKGDTVEVIVRRARFQSPSDRRLGLPHACQVALRQFQPKTFGKITPEDKMKLVPMLEDPSNTPDPLWDRAFYRRFMGGKLRPITPDDILGPGQNL